MSRNIPNAPEHASSGLNTCDRCGGHFPGPGIRQGEHLYCCDKCAQGPSKKMMVRMLLPAAGLITFGYALGWSVTRIRHSHFG